MNRSLIDPASRRLRAYEEAPGAGREAGRRYRHPLWQTEGIGHALPGQYINDRFFDLLTLVFRAPDRTDSTAGRGRPAPWNPRKRFRGRGREPGRRVSSGAKRRASHDDREKMIASGCLSPTKEVTGSQAGHHGTGGRSVRVFMRSRSRLRSILRTRRVREQQGRAGSGQRSKSRRAKAVSAQRLSADGPEHQTEAAERSVRGFMRSRSRPQRPRTGSPNAVRSAGTGQGRSTKCRRGWPVAAQRSSG